VDHRWNKPFEAIKMSKAKDQIAPCDFDYLSNAFVQCEPRACYPSTSAEISPGRGTEVVKIGITLNKSQIGAS
jgi:hypothetical protein